MTKCFSLTATRDWCFRYSFSNAGHRSSKTDLGDGTVMHVWAPKAHIKSKPTSFLIHGIGANAMWQWKYGTTSFHPSCPDSTSTSRTFSSSATPTQPDPNVPSSSRIIWRRSLKRQWRSWCCVCAGVCMEEKDMDEGMFKVKSVDEAVSILLPQKPEKMRELMKISFYKPAKGPTLIIWGEHDQIFPLELANRLKRHLGDNAGLVIIKNAGHAINVEKPKELYKHFKSFLIHSLPASKL
ncbi:Alpha/beta-Hydrolases superfamily protein isoform 5 [Hibiscus syriacus]|uniref:Alpha/beta-Hydrolases superfamily protein isoform 5 n=1 Tax=Hibiscus syriacus TaxID=106335 RepID=A0A6A2X857_HIBSY|nr:Alpha/beta-Hydrolases superfamily protein isoform 5 [Hibiscus syriacus]